VNAKQGWVVGFGGEILATIDGGQTWEEQGSGTVHSSTGQNVTAVDFVDPKHGWAVADFVVLETSNGQDWFKALDLQETKVAVDDGASTSTPTLHGVSFVNAKHGWVVGNGGIILATEDGGRQWKTQVSTTQTNLASVRFLDEKHGWAVGAGGKVIATVDGGLHWNIQITPTTQYLFRVYFSDALRGWAVGGEGTIIATIDGGATWVAQITNVKKRLHGVYFVDANHGLAVGDSTMLTTADGGLHWIEQDSRTP
jgi:photosystem II stability/assembly factor-like uncharacterized protein